MAELLTADREQTRHLPSCSSLERLHDPGPEGQGTFDERGWYHPPCDCQDDREQTRRDEVRKTAVDVSSALHDLAESTGRVIDTLLLALEQAERELDEQKFAAEARLAKVPALVEALRSVARRNVYETVGVAMKIARDALAAYEQEQT